MKKILFIALFFVFVLGFKYAYCEDNILAVDVGFGKEKEMLADKSAQKNEDTGKSEDTGTDEDFDKELKKMRAYREALQNKQKELEVIKLDLEKESLLLKKKEAQKEIYRIDKELPCIAKKEGVSMGSGLIQDVKDSQIDPSDMKIQLLVIADNLKEAQIGIKGVSYPFREGDVILSKLTVEKIEASGVTLRQSDDSILKLNFIN